MSGLSYGFGFGFPRTLLRVGGGAAPAPFTPADLFTSGEEGAWFDPSDLSTMFEDSAGGPPASLESIVGLILDKSKTETLGAELFPADGLDSDTNWTFTGGASTGWTVSGGVAEKVASVNSDAAAYPISFEAGKWYKVQITVVDTGANCTIGIAATIGGAANGANLAQGAISTDDGGPAPGTQFTAYFYATAAASYFYCRGNSAGACQLSNLSIKEVTSAPNHAYQNTDANKPILRARHNLLTYSEQFDNAAWTKSNATITADAAVAPDGTSTADKLIESATTAIHSAFQSRSQAIGTPLIATGYVKAAERTRVRFLYSCAAQVSVAIVDLTDGSIVSSSGNVSVEDAGDGWYKISAWGATTSDTAYLYFQPVVGTSFNYAGNGTSGIYIWGAQLSYGSTALPYQRIAAATDYVTTSTMEAYDFPYYLDFDGVDDFLQTAAIDFSASDEMTQMIGFQNDQFSATTALTELSANSSTTDGTFSAWSVYLANRLMVRSRGSAVALNNPADTFSTNTSYLLGHLADISADTNTLRVDGAEIATDATDQGTGNYSASQPLYVGSRAGTANYHNGMIFSLVIRNALTTGDDLTDLEVYVATALGWEVPVIDGVPTFGV